MPDLTDAELDELDQCVAALAARKGAFYGHTHEERVVTLRLADAAPRLLAEIRTLRDLNAWLIERDEDHDAEVIAARQECERLRAELARRGGGET